VDAASLGWPIGVPGPSKKSILCLNSKRGREMDGWTVMTVMAGALSIIHGILERACDGINTI